MIEEKKRHGVLKSFGLMFHYFHDGDSHPIAQGTVSASQFDGMLDRFLDEDRLLPALEWAYKSERNLLRDGEVCLTFDDALRCQIDVALPILRRRGLTAFWFTQSGVLTAEAGFLEVFRQFRNECFPSIATFYQVFFARALELARNEVKNRSKADMPVDYLAEFEFYTDEDRVFRYLRDKVLGPERYAEVITDMMLSMNTSVEKISAGLFLDANHLRMLHLDGHIVGLHSHSHPTSLEDLPVDQQRQEYETNYRILNDVLGEPPFAVAHPCNSYNGVTLEILCDLGVRIGFRANMVQQRYSNLEWPRMDSADLLKELKCKY